MKNGRAALRLSLAAVLLASCRRGPPALLPGDIGKLLHRDETLLMMRRVPAAPAPGTPGAGVAGPELLVAVARTAEGTTALRIGELRAQGLVPVHEARPGDEFRDLLIEDVNADGHPEVVSLWTGGHLEVVEVLGRGAGGAWSVLLQNAGEIVEQRRMPDGTTAFWITSRTYEDKPGQPPVYDTRVFRWDGSAFAPVAP